MYDYYLPSIPNLVTNKNIYSNVNCISQFTIAYFAVYFSIIHSFIFLFKQTSKVLKYWTTAVVSVSRRSEKLRSKDNKI